MNMNLNAKKHGVGNWFAYHISPIDFRWEYLPTVGDVARAIGAAQVESMLGGSHPELTLEAFRQRFTHAKQLAEGVRWEGDFRGDAHVLWLPDDGTFAFAFVWKQDNNGSTFVVSPIRLPWLDSLSCL